MAGTYKYIIDFIANNSKFVSSMNQNVEKLGNVEKKVKTAQQQVNGMSDSLKKVGSMLGVAFSVGAIVSFGKASIEAYDVQAKAEQALLTALKGRTDVQQRLIAQAGELQKKTLFGDEETIRAQSLVAAFVKEEDKIKTLIPLIQDMATAKQMDLAGAADLVTKTLAGEMNALGRYGIKVEGAAGSAERLKMITDGLSKAFAGQSEAAAKVGSGALKQLSNDYGDLMEVIGRLTITQQNQEGSFTKLLASATRGVSGFLGKVATWSESGLSFSQSLVAGFLATDKETAKLAESMIVVKKTTDDASNTATGAAAASKYQAGSVGALGEQITKLNEQLANTNASDRQSILTIGQKIQALELQKAAVAGLMAMETSQAKIKAPNLDIKATTTVKGPLTSDLKLNPTLNVGRTNLGPTFAKDAEQVETENKRIQKILDATQAKVQALQGAFESGFTQIGQSVLKGFGLAADGFEGFISGLADTVMKLIAMMLSESLANSIAGATASGAATGPAAIFTTPAFIATAVGGVLAAFASIPAFAAGALAYGPTMGLMGEYPGAASNPEVIAPLSKLKGLIGGASTGSATITLQPSIVYSGDQFRVFLNRVEKNVKKRT